MSFRALALVLGLATAAYVTSGCGASSAEAPAQTAQAATKAPFTVPAHGFVKASLDALGDVALRPDQRAPITDLAKDAEARHAATRQAREALMLAVADQVQAGTIDKVALQPKIDALEATMKASKPLDGAALEKLHAILDPDQRAAFIAALQAKWHDHDDHDDDGPAAGPGGPGGPGAGGGRGMGFGPMGRLGAELKLTDDQRDKIRAAFIAQHNEGGGGPGAGMHDWRGARDRITKMTDAFKSDHFVVAELEGDHAGKDFMSEHGDKLFKLAATVLPILTPEQRATLATKIRDQAKDAEH